MALPEINFLYIQAGDGTTGTTGDQLEARWSTNFNMIKTFLKSLDEDIQTRIMSKQIKEIKVDRGVAYFTVNGTDWFLWDQHFLIYQVVLMIVLP